MNLGTETLRVSHSWRQHKGHGCRDTLDAVGAQIPHNSCGQGPSKGPGCLDTPTALGAEMSHHSMLGPGSPDLLPLQGLLEPLNPCLPHLLVR